MKLRLLLLLSYVSIRASSAQTTGTDRQKALAYFQETQQASAGQTLWPAELYGPMLLVDPQSRMTWANWPDSSGILKPDGAIYTGRLPSDVLIANTAIRWQGRLWSVLLWPLPENRQERLSLLLHESFHRIQEALSLPANDPTLDHLGTMQGRVYFLLELQALNAALHKPLTQRQPDLMNALLFRKKRQLLFPKTFSNEQLLEMNEGLAEFTGVLLGRQADSLRTYLDELVRQAAERPSLIRSAAYFTGPLYGYLLYQNNPQWTTRLTVNASFPQLMATNYQLPQVQPLTARALATATDAYQGKAIIRSEQVKENERQQRLHRYIDLFTKRAVLSIDLVKMTINFNPNTLFTLGVYGTVYPTARIKDRWGELEVTGGGLLMNDWKSVSVPVSSKLVLTDKIIQGTGWKLTLAKGWVLRKRNALHYTVVPVGR